MSVVQAQLKRAWLGVTAWLLPGFRVLFLGSGYATTQDPRSRSLTLSGAARVTSSRDAVSLGTNFPFDIPFPLLFSSWC